MTRTRIINEARSWIGTRFVHQGRVKKSEQSRGGCDCIGFIIGVASALEINCNGVALSSLDSTGYSRVPDGSSLKQALDRNLPEIPVNKAVPGDILLLKINKYPQHVAFIGDYAGSGLSLIHCFIQARGVIEHSLDDCWRKRIVAAYQLVSE